MLHIRSLLYVQFLVMTLSACASDWAIQQLENMSIREMVAQLFMVTAISNPRENEGYFKKPWKGDPEYVSQLITDYKVGGVAFLGSCGLIEQHRKVCNYFQQLSEIPLLVGIDGEWLPFRINDIPTMPSAMTLGALHDESLIYTYAQERAEQCKALGAHIDFGPVCDVNTNPLNPIIGMRSYGDDKESVARKATLFIKGLQDSGMIACAKHFPGHGDTSYDSHIQLPTLNHTKERLEEVELYPFKRAIQEKVMAIMPGHLEIPALEEQAGLPATLSSAILTDLLRKELGFDGLIITDALPMGALEKFEPGYVELKALVAGNDILLCSSDVPAAIDYIVKAIDNGSVSLDLIKERVLRVLKAKQWILEHRESVFVQPDEILKLHSDQLYDLKKHIFENVITHIPYVNNEVGSEKTAHYHLQVGSPQETDFKYALAQEMDITTDYCNWLMSEKELESLHEKYQDEEAIIVSVYSPIAKESIAQEEKYANNSESWYQNLIKKLTAFVFTKKEVPLVVPEVSISAINLLEQLVNDGKKITFVIFGSPYIAMELKKYGEIILAYEKDPYVQQLVAQVVCKKHTAKGSLPIVM